MVIMQMGPKEIARDYRTAANKMKQIKVLAELNQCSERKIAEILDDEGVELPKKWADQLSKPARRSRKYQATEAEAPEAEPPEAPEATEPAPMAAEESRVEDPSTPAAPPLRMTGEAEAVTDRDLFKAVATLLPEPEADRQRPGENGVPVAPRTKEEAESWVDGVGPVTKAAEAVPTAAPEKTATATLETSAWKRAVELKIAQVGISDEELLRAACRMLTSALALEPDEYHTYSCGVLDLVHALTEEEV